MASDAINMFSELCFFVVSVCRGGGGGRGGGGEGVEGRRREGSGTGGEE